MCPWLGLASVVVSALSSSAPADLILRGGTVILLDPPGATASALAVRGDRIVFVGSDAEAAALAGPGTRVVDLAGRTVIPGLTDAHGHVSSLGFALSRVNAGEARTPSEVAARLKEALRHAGPGEWIEGRGWDQNTWARKEFPTAAVLDEVSPDHPVALVRVDGHALWVNSAAMRIAAIDRKTPDPEGGRILRDREGHPTGVLVDNAMDLVRAKIPAPGRDQTKAALLRGLNHCLDFGLTEVHDAGISPEEASIYRELAAAGALPIRVYAMLGGTSRTLKDYFAEPPLIGYGGGFLTIRAIKLAVDGALGSRGAALFDDYSDEPGARGLVTRPVEEIQALASQAIGKGFQVCVHAIGDRGNALVLDAMEAALRAAPPGDYRFRIEHAQVLRLSDIPRFKALGIIASMQPVHCTSDMAWAEDRLGASRIQGAYAWRRLLDAGAALAFGSDFPVESENPFAGLYAAVTRQDAKGRPRGGWTPDQRLTMEEALRAFTRGAAYAAFEEGDRGSIAAGRLADLVVLKENPLTASPLSVLEARPEMVIVAGRIVREKP